MSVDEAMYRQVYDQIANAIRLPKYRQIIGTPQSFAFAPAPIGQIDPRAYQIVSNMPAWSPVGDFSSLNTRLFDAVQSLFQHVSFVKSPEVRQREKELQEDVTNKRNAATTAESDMNQAYLAAKQNGGLVFAARYKTLDEWITKAPEAAAYAHAIDNASAAYSRAVDFLLEIQQAGMPSDLQDAVAIMKMPTDDPAKATAPRGWTKVAGGDGILRWQPEWKIGTDGTDWRAELTNGTAGAFEISLDQADANSDFSHSWAGGKAGYGNVFWSVSASGGWDRSDLFQQDSRVKVTVKVQSSTRVPVSPGDWYPGGFLRNLALAPQGPGGQGYTILAPWTAKGGSSPLFGAKGLAATMVAELIVVQKPSFTITMDSRTYQQNKQKFDASAGLRIGPFSFGGSGGHESEFTKDSRTANTFTGGSTSEDPQIIGVVVAFPGDGTP